MKRKIAFYLRSSTEGQEYEYQREFLNGNLKQQDELVEVFEEKISGFKSEEERPEMKKLLERVAKGAFDEIWATEFTRVSRSQLGLLKIIDALDKAPNASGGVGVNLYVSKDGLSTFEKVSDLNPKPNHITRLILSILSSYGEIEAKTMRFRMGEGKRDSVRNANYIGGTLPYGYSYEDNGNKNKPIVVDPIQKETVLRIFRDYALRLKTLYEITQELNLEQIPTKNKLDKKGKDSPNYWTQTTVRNIIKSTFYIGKRVYKGEEISLPQHLVFTELLSEKVKGSNLWEESNRLLKANKNRLRPRNETYLLTDIMYCECGGRMYSRSNANRDHSRWRSYSCYVNFLDFSRTTKVCDAPKKSFAMEKVDRVVWSFVKNKLDYFKIEVGRQITIKDEVDRTVKSLNKEIAKANNNIEKLQKNKERAARAYTAGKMEFETYVELIDENDRDTNRFLYKIKEYEAEIYSKKRSLETFNIADEISVRIAEIEQNKVLMKHYLKKLIKSITVHYNVETKDVLLKVSATSGELNTIWIIYNNRPSSNELYYYMYDSFILQQHWDEGYNAFIIALNQDFIDYIKMEDNEPVRANALILEAMARGMVLDEHFSYLRHDTTFLYRSNLEQIREKLIEKHSIEFLKYECSTSHFNHMGAMPIDPTKKVFELAKPKPLYSIKVVRKGK